MALAALLVLPGCAHRSIHGCRESVSYELLDDGSLVYRGSVTLPSGASAEPFRIFAPSDPDYQRHLDHARRLAPGFESEKRAAGAEWVPC
jgi:hypothetical protein